MYRHGKDEVGRATQVLESGSWFRYYGSERHLGAAAELEKRIAEYTGARYVLATSSGTGALIASLAALGIGPQEEVIVPAYTFIATAAAVIAVGAVPVIAEIDSMLTLDPEDVVRKVSPRTRAVIPVHMLGFPCRMDRLMEVAKEHGLAVLEDAAQAVGASWQGRPAGTIGDIGVYSFQWHKTITTGEGGCVLTDDPYLYERAVIYHDDAHCFRGIDRGIPAFPGVNLRMSEIAASVGCAQIERLPGIAADLRGVKRRVMDALGDIHPFRVVATHDPEGDGCTTLVVSAPDGEQAERFGAALGAGSILNTERTNWHIYYHWDYILEKRSVSGSGFPWRVGEWESPVEYSKDMCPKTLDVLKRSFGFGLSPDWTDGDIGALADRIRAAAGRPASIRAGAGGSAT